MLVRVGGLAVLAVLLLGLAVVVAVAGHCREPCFHLFAEEATQIKARTSKTPNTTYAQTQLGGEERFLDAGLDDDDDGSTEVLCVLAVSLLADARRLRANALDGRYARSGICSSSPNNSAAASALAAAGGVKLSWSVC